MRGALPALLLLVFACASGTSPDTPVDGTLDESTQRAAQAASRELDAIAKDLEDFGSVSVSASAVLRKPQGFFGFRLTLTPDEIFKRERIEATSRVSDFQAIDIRLALAMKYLKEANEETDPAKAEAKRGAAEAELASALTDEASAKAAEPAPAPPASDNPNEDAAKEKLDLPTNEAKAALPKEFSAALAAREGPMTLSLRQLIQLAFNDHITLKLFEWLSDPDPYVLGENKTLFAAVLNVSVRPGKRTYEGYVGEVDVRVGYARGGQDSVNANDQHPLSFAVFPGLDTQVIDERTSVRRQLAVALLIAAQAPKVDGNLAVDFVRRLEQDVATVTGRNTVVGYNMAGRHFGWRFQPRLEAQADPSSIRTKPALQLQAQTFPALVLILADNEDLDTEVLDEPGDMTELQRRVAVLEDEVKAARARSDLLTERDRVLFVHIFNRIRELTTSIEQLRAQESVKPQETESALKMWGGEIRALWELLRSGTISGPPTPHVKSDHFVFYQSMRWLPAPAPGIDLGSWLLRPFRRMSHSARHPRLPETKQIDWAIRLAKVEKLIGQIRGIGKLRGGINTVTGTIVGDDAFETGSAGTGGLSRVANALNKRRLMLEAASVGADVYAEIPKPRLAPTVEDAGTVYRGWQNRPTSIGIRGSYFKGQVLGAVVGTRLCSVSVVSDSAVVVACDPWTAEKHPDPGAQAGFPVYLVTTRGRLLAGHVVFDLKADEAEIRPFATLVPVANGTSDKSLAFQLDGKLLPKWRDSFELWLRSTTDVTAVPTLVSAKVTIDLAYKARVEFDPGKSFVKVDRLEVDLRLKPNPDAPAVSVTVRVGPAGATSLPVVLYYPDDGARSLTMSDVKIEFDKDGKIKSTAPVILKYAEKYGGVAQLKDVFPQLKQDLPKSVAKLVIPKSAKLTQTPSHLAVAETSNGLEVQPAAFKEPDALAPADGTEEKFQKLQLKLSDGMTFDITGTLTGVREKK